MKIKKWLSPKYYVFHNILYREKKETDYRYNAAFRGVKVLPKSFLKGYEWKYICCYRKWQCNRDNIWGRFYERKLTSLSQRTGIDLDKNPNIGDGFILGHWGRIIVNRSAKFGSPIFLTHGVTIGRDIRGKRKGVPTFGNYVCIRANSTVVGNVHIGNDVLIAPNTFVNFDVPDHSIVIGNPASIHHRDNATEGHLPVINI
ncbi:MAG: serine acetyltransferase [Acetatifactor sp.]|nr:serine acetyltransferase [Acetatifactor sp.]